MRTGRSLIALLLVLAMVFSLCACGQAQDDNLIEELDTLPDNLSGRKLSDEELLALSGTDPQAMRAAISTVEDAAAWFALQGEKGYGDESACSLSDLPDCKFYFSPASMLRDHAEFGNGFGTDTVSMIAAWLLQDDYAGSGIVMDLEPDGFSNVLLCIPQGDAAHLINVIRLIPGAGKGAPLYQLVKDPGGRVRGLSTKANGERALITDLEEGIVWRTDQRGITGTNSGFLLAKGTTLLREVPEEKRSFPLDEEELSSLIRRLNRDMGMNLSGTEAPASVLENYDIRRLSAEERIALPGEQTLSDEQLAALGCDDFAALKEALSTPEDVAAWLRLQDFAYWDGAMVSNSSTAILYYYPTPEFMLHPNGLDSDAKTYIGRDSINLFAAALLQDDYEDCGALLVIVPDNLFGFLNYSAVCIRLGDEYCLFNMAAMIDMVTISGGTESVELLDGLALRDLGRITEYIDYCTSADTIQHGEIALVRDFDSPTYYYSYGDNAFFRDPDALLCAKQPDESPTAYMLSHGAPGQEWALRSFDIADFALPCSLGEAKLSDAEIDALVGQDVDTVAAKVNTVADLIRYLHAGGFSAGSGDIWQDDAEDGDICWHFNKTARTANLTRCLDCGATANLVRRLLDGDYPEVGYMLHTYRVGEGGGHVYNYVFDGETYYVMDLMQLTGSHFDPAIHWMVDMDELSEYAHKYRDMAGYGNYLPVVYAYDAPDEIPLAWGKGEDGCSVTWYPTGTQLQIIVEDRAAGYSVDYRELGEETAAAIARARTDGLNNLAYFRADEFPGVEVYSFPAAFGKASMSYDEMLELAWTADLETLAKEIKTVPDLLMFFHAAGYGGNSDCEGNSDIQLGTESNLIWHYNHYAERCRYFSTLGCGQCEALTRYLLDGDYDEVGTISCTWAEGEGGGHNFNYLKIGGEYYVLDMNSYEIWGYAPPMSYWLSLGSDLMNFRSKWSKMYSGSNMVCCYAMTRMREIPVGWEGDSIKVSYLPEQYENEIRILWTTEDEGYTYQFIPLSDEIEAYMDIFRAAS